MSNNVFANGNAIACKAGDDKVIASMPDVCLSPPSPPAGPVPVPYPNTSFSKDMQSGSKTVEINGKEVMLKDKSFYKTSPLGDEAATNSFGGSVITHTITGKTYFSAWSMDVKFEGENVPRHLDLTTSNHNPYPGSTAPTPAQEDALKAISENRCPCCNKKECAAAFRPGDVALTQEEFYNIGKDSNAVTRWREDYKQLKKIKKQNCTCKPPSKSFPKAPCDVFRAPDEARHTAIEKAWDPAVYRKWYEKAFGVILKDAGYYLGIMLEATGNAAALLAASKLPKQQRRGNPLGDQMDKINGEANKSARINHLTPKDAGGCPTSPDNLQPQQVMCADCQDIDQHITDSPIWQG
jgi:Domain of unknown function (DUF4150)